MSKASERISGEWGHIPEPRPPCAEFILAKIRARRDELLPNPGDPRRAAFWQLFDDGAEFGPDKPEPPKTLIRRLACPDGVLVEVQTNGRVETISEEAANELKKLGAEEAKK